MDKGIKNVLLKFIHKNHKFVNQNYGADDNECEQWLKINITESTVHGQG